MSRLSNKRHIVGKIIPAKKHKKGALRSGNSRNGIEVLLSNRLEYFKTQELKDTQGANFQEVHIMIWKSLLLLSWLERFWAKGSMKSTTF